MEGADEGRETHCAGEDEMGPLPGGEEVGFVALDGFDDGGNAGGAAWGEFASVLVGGLDYEGEEDGAQEGDDGEYDEGEGADAPNVTEGVFRGGDVGLGVVAEVDFTDPGCAVKEEGEPTC